MLMSVTLWGFMHGVMQLTSTKAITGTMTRSSSTTRWCATRSLNGRWRGLVAEPQGTRVQRLDS